VAAVQGPNAHAVAQPQPQAHPAAALRIAHQGRLALGTNKARSEEACGPSTFHRRAGAVGVDDARRARMIQASIAGKWEPANVAAAGKSETRAISGVGVPAGAVGAAGVGTAAAGVVKAAEWRVGAE
jgi:hypothetical protein